jgi:hypothetical protein
MLPLPALIFLCSVSVLTENFPSSPPQAAPGVLMQTHSSFGLKEELPHGPVFGIVTV